MLHKITQALGFAGAVVCSSWIWAIPAFPGAEGAGANALGGRYDGVFWNDVYHVTTLAADDPNNPTIVGSLLYGLKNAPPGGRYIVFDVGGTIDMGGADWDFSPNRVYLAGQTAPGGITLINGEFNPGGSNHIFRNITIRRGGPTSLEKDAFWFVGNNSIIDHVTTSWHTDEGISVTDGAYNVTVQYSIISEGLSHADGGDGSQIEGYTSHGKISFHHNLYAHNKGRVPRVGEKVGIGVDLDWRNNVIYNTSSSYAGYSVSGEPSFNNFVNNYYIRGANNPTVIFNSGGTLTSIYQSGNLVDTNRNGVPDGVDLGWTVFTGTETQLSTPLSIPHGVTQTADQALQTVLAYAGANWWERSSIDTRIINQVKSYGLGTVGVTGQVITSVPTDEWNALANAPMTTRPTGWDTDRDGMPNYWEIAHGLNPMVGGLSQYSGDFDNDGYNNIEEYLNEIAAFPAPFPINWTGGNARYARIENWSITASSPGEGPTTTNWQPSRYDVAIINGGTATVDAVGQHAGTLIVGSSAASALVVTGGWLIVENRLEIGNSGTATLSGGALRVGDVTRVRESGKMTFGGGQLDLMSGAAIFDYSNPGSSPLALLRDQIVSGRNGGLWNGPGIISSYIASLPGTGIGIAEASDLGVTTFAGESVDSTTVLLAFTWLGDADLDGDVDNADFGRFFAHFQQSGVGWFDGDFDYDGDVDNSDFGLFFGNFGSSGLAPVAEMLPFIQAISVPEPATAGLAVLCLAGVLSRRRTPPDRN